MLSVLLAFTFYNIAQFSPDREAELAQDMIEYQTRTGNDIVLYMMTFQPEGRPAWTKVERQLASYRKLKRELDGSGVKLGVLVQSLLGHWPRVEKDEEPWTHSITLEGKEKRICPEDPGFRRYIADVFAALAKERPSFVMLDDDVHATGYFGVECFCPRHTEMFNRANGTAFSPEEFRRAVAGCQPGDKVSCAFRQQQHDFVFGVLKTVRSSLDAVDPTIPVGVCGGGCEDRFSGDYALGVAARGQPPVLRVGNGHYNRRSLAGFAGNVAITQAYADYNRKVPVVLDESDTFPHHRWSMSAMFLDMKLQAGAFCGLRGAKIWYVNSSKYARPVSRSYTDILARHRKVYPALADAVAETVPEGVVVPSLLGRSPWSPNVRDSFTDGASWITGMFGSFGIPFVCREDVDGDDVYALAGEQMAKTLPVDVLRKIFARRVLVDGAAALALTERGLGELLGVKVEFGRSIRYNIEFCPETGAQFPFSNSDKTPFLTPLAPEAVRLTSLGYQPYFGVTEIEEVAPASVRTTNALGGRVVVTAYHAMGMSMFDPPMSEARKEWVLGHLKALDWKGVTALNDQDVLLLSRRRCEGGRLIAVFNTGFDPLERIRLNIPSAYRRVEHLQEDGIWRVCEAKRSDDGAVELPVRLECANTAVFKVDCP